MSNIPKDVNDFIENVATGESKKLDKIVKGKVTTKKPSVLTVLKDNFIQEDFGKIKQHVTHDIFVPALKKTAFDIIQKAAGMMLGQNVASLFNSNPYTYYNNQNPQRNSYTSYYNNQNNTAAPVQNRVRTQHDILLEDQGEAVEVLNRMNDIIAEYGVVSINDLNDLVGINGSHTDCKYGWTSLKTGTIVQTPEGFLIKLPKPIAL